MFLRTARLVAPVVSLLCLLALVAAVALTGLSCAKSAHESAPPPPSAPSAAPGAAGGAPAAGMMKEAALDQATGRSGPVSSSAESASGGESSSAAPPENALDVNKVRASQMIIWKAEYDVRVDKAADAADKFRALVEKNGGFLSAQNKKVDESGNTRVVVEARVPSVKFWNAVNGLETLGKVESGNTTSDNVTEEWVDLGARLHVKNLRMAQLEALLKKAQSVQEIDQRQQQILAVQEEIERIQGRQRYLQNQVALSTINATFYEKGLAPMVQPGPFSVKNTLLRSWYDLQVVLEVLFRIAAWLVIVCAPLWIAIAIVVAVRRRRKSSAPPPSA